MVTDFLSAFAGVRHVAIGAGDTRTRVYALVPHFKLRVLSDKQFGVAISPILMTDFVIVSENIVSLEALIPGMRGAFFRFLEVILRVTLTANVTAHFLACRHFIDVVILNAKSGFIGADTFHKSRAGDAQLARLRVVTVNT